MSEQQFNPPDPRRAAVAAVVSEASLKYQRAAQVAADASYAMYNRLATRALMNDSAVLFTVAAVPVLMEAILADEDIMDPQAEE